LKHVFLTVLPVLEDADVFAVCSQLRYMAKWIVFNASPWQVFHHCRRGPCPTGLEFYFKEHKYKLFYIGH
jgi:hypothetical protein